MQTRLSPKPQGLTVTALLLTLCCFAIYLLPAEVPREWLIVYWFIVSFGVCVSLLVVWCYWQGRNWARVLVLTASMVAIYNLSYLSHAQSVERFLLIAEGTLATFLLYWLNTNPVSTYFKRSLL
ncbi:MAG: hypothetical protein OHK0029_23600 [Armatimonadaceae bacterium]